MKKVTDLKENECIHCTTKEDFKAILELNPKNDLELRHWDDYYENTVYYPANDCLRGDYGSFTNAKEKNYTIYPASDFLQPTYQLTKEQILAIAENGSLVKELFPDAFEESLEVGKWYKSRTKYGHYKNIFYNIDGINCYGFENDKYFEKGFIGNTITKSNLEPATTEEVTEALINEAKRRGFKVGVKYDATNIGFPNQVVVIDEGIGYKFDIEENILRFNDCRIFDNGIWAEIITTPTEVIKVI